MHRWLISSCKLIGLVAAILLIGLQPPLAVAAQTSITATADTAKISFPDTITFSVTLESETEIQQVVLEYHVQQHTCGEVIAKAFPEITPGKSVSVEWTWEMKQSGALPPGATIFWQWQVTDSEGKVSLTEQQTVTWLDNIHNWDVIRGDNINLHWYEGGQSFGQELHDAAVEALANLKEQTGLYTALPVDLYIYASFEDLRDAILYEPGWVGGQAFPDYNIVIIGISPDNLVWGKDTESHELTHVLVGNLTFSCLGYVPTWLNEGLAMYGEGGPDPASQENFDKAVTDDTLPSVRALSGGFSEAPDKADISYSQSYSLVKFLIDEYGKDKILDLLGLLREGGTPDVSLQTLYGFDLDGLEDAWRAAIGAKPRAITADATPTRQPTTVPTFAPVSAEYASPTSAPTQPPATATPVPPTASATLQEPPTEEAQPTDAGIRTNTPAPRRTIRPTMTAPAPVETVPTTSLPDTLRNILSFSGICLVILVVIFAFYFAVLHRPRRRRKE